MMSLLDSWIQSFWNGGLVLCIYFFHSFMLIILINKLRRNEYGGYACGGVWMRAQLEERIRCRVIIKGVHMNIYHILFCF